MELTLPMLCERDLPVLRRDPRLSVRAVVDFRIIVADKAGIASGQVINMTNEGVRPTPHETPEAWTIPDAHSVPGRRPHRRAM